MSLGGYEEAIVYPQRGYDFIYILIGLFFDSLSLFVGMANSLKRIEAKKD